MIFASSKATTMVLFATAVDFTDDAFTVQLDDGRALAIPLAWYPRLLQGTVEERLNHVLIGHGEGIHWPALDEDISVEGLIAGRRSCESSASLSQWVEKRLAR